MHHQHGPESRGCKSTVCQALTHEAREQGKRERLVPSSLHQTGVRVACIVCLFQLMMNG